MDKKQRRFIAPLLGVAAILGAVAIYMMMVTMPSKDVDMPADDASPELVVAAYMEALDSHDCETAQALVTAPKRDSVDLWCRTVASITDATVTAQPTEPSGLPGPTNLSSSAESATSWEVVNVSVTFDVKHRLFHSDISLPDGPTTWGYVLQRASSEEPWRIFDEGNG